MNPTEELSAQIGVLLDGWNERIEYVRTFRVHTPQCQVMRTVMDCNCPETMERRAESRRQLPIVTQLTEAGYTVPVTGGGGPGGGKPKSKPPGNLLRPDELMFQLTEVALRYCGYWGISVPDGRDRAVSALRALVSHCLEGNRDHPDHGDVFELNRELRNLIRQCRIFLGYESESKMLADSVCGNCGGGLAVAEDASSDVRCVGSPARASCGERYAQHDWVRLYEAGHAAGKVDTAAAVRWSGRKAAILSRWAAEGRITRCGGRGKGQARWDLAELPRFIPGGPLPPPPPLPLDRNGIIRDHN